MVKMAQSLTSILRRWTNKDVIVSPQRVVQNAPVFDKKYKIILECKYDERAYDMLEWVNKFSNGAVDVKNKVKSTEPQTIQLMAYFAFEDLDDALIFRIKYSI